MYKAIIVEDELLVRIAYQSIVDWTAYGFELAGMFENGQAALDAFDDIQPDFVLTDTKMPLCDGITLVREIKRRAPETICVILSAYGDLDYVKEGIRVGADDYLLKLDITQEKLGRLLESTAKRLHDMRRSGVEKVSNDRKMGRERFLRSWMRGEFSERDTIQDYLKFYGIKFYQQRFLCMSVCINELDGGIRKTPGEEMSAAIKQTLEQTLNSSGTWLLVDLSATMFYALGIWADGSPQQYIENVKSSVLFSLKSVMNLSSVVINTGIAEDIVDISAVFRQIHSEEEKDTRDKTLEHLSTLVEEIVSALQKLRYAQVTAGLRKMNQLFSGTTLYSAELVRNHCFYILMSLSGAMKKDPILESLLQELYPLLRDELWNCFFLRELASWLDNLCILLEQMEQTRAPSASLAAKAASYIHEHYIEDLSLDKIARHIKISPTYLSRIFSQEHGKGIQEYLTELRIQKAKQLLAETDCKIYEIAANVGYQDAIYFNKLFKRRTGKTPKEYRMLKMTIDSKNRQESSCSSD